MRSFYKQNHKKRERDKLLLGCRTSSLFLERTAFTVCLAFESWTERYDIKLFPWPNPEMKQYDLANKQPVIFHTNPLYTV